jgi:hypothetical protein
MKQPSSNRISYKCGFDVRYVELKNIPTVSRYEEYGLLGCEPMYFQMKLSLIRRNLLPPSSG